MYENMNTCISASYPRNNEIRLWEEDVLCRSGHTVFQFEI